MPRPVRVHPLGDPVAVEERGSAFGNRGVLHDGQGRIVRGWQGRRWIVCVTAFKGRHRDVMPPGGFTGLFFRDEATGLAAGHRPCAECRRADFDAFRAAWARATGGGGLPDVETRDRALHAERLEAGARPAGGVQAARRLPPLRGRPDLPEGTVVLDAAGDAHVVTGEGLRRWAFGPLGAAARATGPLRLVTPPSSVAVLRAGYAPSLVPLVAP